MLKGDLATTPVEIALTNLAAEQATGCLHVVDDDGAEALIYLRGGLVYAVSVPGQRPQLGARLISSNALVPENLAEALEAQRTELQGWRLGELLVHLGFVEQDVVEAFVQEQVRDGFTDLMAWTSGRWRFRKAEKTREDIAPPTPLEDLLAEVNIRRSVWDDIVNAVHGPNAVPMLAAHGGEADITLDPDTWSLLCKIDGERSIADLARECGFTLFEAGNVVRALVEAGLVDVEEDLGPTGVPLALDDDDAATGLAVADADGEGAVTEEIVETAEAGASRDDFPRTAALAAAFALSGNDSDGHTVTETIDELGAPSDTSRSDDGMPSLARLSEALTQMLGPRQDDASSFVDPFHVPEEIRLRARPKAAPAPVERTEDDLRRDRIRHAAAAELAAAHAEAEATRYAQSGKKQNGRIADVVDLEARREAARVDGERREAERLAAEEAARVETERVEAARLEAERLEAERLEAERLAAEEAARVEAARLEAERAAAEEAARAEAERLAAQEAERIEAEEAARLEAERAAAEEAARAEAERLAAEEAERIEAEEAAHSKPSALLPKKQPAGPRLEAERLSRGASRADRSRRGCPTRSRARGCRSRPRRSRTASRGASRTDRSRRGCPTRSRARGCRRSRTRRSRTASRGASRTDRSRRSCPTRSRKARLPKKPSAPKPNGSKPNGSKPNGVEAERVEAERVEAERAEAERVEAERVEAERLEAERVEAERLEAERLEAERVEAERLEAERLEAERLEAERLEAERLEAERLEAGRLAAEEAARIEAERLAAEQLARLEEGRSRTARS